MKFARVANKRPGTELGSRAAGPRGLHNEKPLLALFPKEASHVRSEVLGHVATRTPIRHRFSVSISRMAL